MAGGLHFHGIENPIWIFPLRLRQSTGVRSRRKYRLHIKLTATLQFLPEILIAAGINDKAEVSFRHQVRIAQTPKKENGNCALWRRATKSSLPAIAGWLAAHSFGDLQAEGFKNLLTRDRTELYLTNENAVGKFFASEKPAIVILAAAKVGGIKANTDAPVEFLLQNLRIQSSVINAAHDNGARKLLFLGSSCIYPRHAPQPIPENALLTGLLEPTNEPYAVAKIAGIKLCQAFSREYGVNFISPMPSNLYGPNDDFDLNLRTSRLRSCASPRREDERHARTGRLGLGSPRREFLHVDDLAFACLFLLEKYDSPEIINVGSGEDLTVRELAELICDVVGFDGDLAWQTKPDGTPRKLLDVHKLDKLGWRRRFRCVTGSPGLMIGFFRTWPDEKGARWHRRRRSHRK